MLLANMPLPLLLTAIAALLLHGCSTSSSNATNDSGVLSDAQADVGPDVTDDVGPPIEDCHNGVDDDDDGLIDCADPDCEPVVVCVPAAPSPWSPPGVLHEGESAAPCEGAFGSEAYVGHDEPSGEPAECESSCECTNPVSSGCSTPYVCQKSGSCGGTCNAGGVSGTGCLTSPGASTHIVVTSWDSGSCTPSEAPTPTLAPATWGAEARLCTSSAAAGGCEEAEVCVPRVAEETPLCVFHEGDEECPEGFDDRRVVYFGDFADGRACSDCECGYASDGCEVTATAFSEAGCTGTETELLIDACNTGNAASFFVEEGPPSNPRCNAYGGDPTGDVEAAEPTTVCCRAPQGA
jgi:hypothetical protein